MSKVNKEKIAEMRELKKQGKTYQEIGNILGISRQRVHYLIGNKNEFLFKKILPNKCIYVGLRKWMNENKVCFSELTRQIYGHSNPNNQALVKKRISGKTTFHKPFIDSILKITGLTYEEAFKIED